MTASNTRKTLKKNCWHVAYSSDWYHLSWDRLLLYWQSWDSMFVLYLRPRHAQWFRCVAAFMTISSFWSSVPLVLGKKVLFELKMQTHTYKVHMCIIHMYMTCMYVCVQCRVWHDLACMLCNLLRCWHFVVPGSSRRSFIDFVRAGLRFYLVNFLNLISFSSINCCFWLGFGSNLYPPDLRGSKMAEQLFCWLKAEAKSHERQALQAWQRQVEDCRESAREVQGKKQIHSSLFGCSITAHICAGTPYIIVHHGITFSTYSTCSIARQRRGCRDDDSPSEGEEEEAGSRAWNGGSTWFNKVNFKGKNPVDPACKHRCW